MNNTNISKHYRINKEVYIKKLLLLVKKSKKINLNKLNFVLVFFYLSFINFAVFKTTPEIIFLQFLVLIILFRKFQSMNFIKAWLPFISLFVLYEFLRGYADDWSPFYDITLFWVYRLEENIFGILPSLWLQKKLPNSSFITQLALSFYSIFFYYSFLVAFIIWLKNEKVFADYAKKFLLVTYIALLFFFLIPTAPPWFAAKEFNIPIIRYLQQDTILKSFSTVSIYQYFFYNNLVAALPSLHVGWPLFSTLYLIKTYKNKWLYSLLIIPLAIGFSIVLTGEHYIIDVLASLILVLYIVYIHKKVAHINHKQ